MKIICIGRNYAEHAKELGNAVPTEPVFFCKPDSAILPKGNPFFIPDFSNDVHHEVEVVVKIKKPGRHIPVGFAKDYYDEVALGIDFTARDVQSQLKAKGLPWEKAKAFDGSTLIGEWYNKKDFESIENLSFSLEKNGEKVQEGSTANMLWKIDELIAYCSQYFTLKIGDVLFTGTPSGVGAVSIEDHLVGYLEGNQAFSVKIK